MAPSLPKEEKPTSSRGSGILLHITSLPSSYGIGDLGPEAYRFVDFLAESKQKFWQILPLNPTEPVHQHSPYASNSAFALNPLLVSPETLVREGFLEPEAAKPLPAISGNKVDYRTVLPIKKRILERAYEHFCKEGENPAFTSFCREEAAWLDDFALFQALREKFQGQVWNEWPLSIRDRAPEALAEEHRELKEAINFARYSQFLIWKQWHSLKEYCRRKGVQVIGDIPIYVDYGGCDAWVHPEFFKLDDWKKPRAVAGVPPDYFSATGQLWGNPVYDWDSLRKKDYGWWVQRIGHNLKLFDYVRIDHFRGLVAYWEVPATEKTAMNGKWIPAPAVDFFELLQRTFPSLPIIAEDLGTITEDVREVLNRFEIPGMKVLLFAFGDGQASHPYLPHNLPRNCVAYTGTHDNNTIKGWFEKEATPEEKKRLFRYLGHDLTMEELPRELIRMMMMSVANWVIFPFQDILGLGEEARMNCPSTLTGNWECRLLPDWATPEVVEMLREMTELYGRA